MYRLVVVYVRVMMFRWDGAKYLVNTFTFLSSVIDVIDKVADLFLKTYKHVCNGYQWGSI